MSRNAFASSFSRSFIRSLMKARGRYGAGIKTAHSCLPYIGYGNVLLKGGGIDYDPAIPWIYTRKTIVESWTHTFTVGGHSYTIPEQQASRVAFLLANGFTQFGSGRCADSGYFQNFTTGQTLCLNDFSDPSYSVFPTPPAAVSTGSSGNKTKNYHSYFNVSGTTLSVPENVSGTTAANVGFETGVFNAPFTIFDPQTGVDELHTSTTSQYSSEYGLPDRTVSYDKSTDAHGVHIRQLYKNFVCAYGAATVYDHIIFGGGFSAYQNMVYGTEMVVYDSSTIYSDPISINDLEARAGIMLGAVHFKKTSERYDTFDGSPPVVLNWNPTNWGSLSPSQVILQRAEYSGGALGGYSNIAAFVGSPDALATTFTDTTAAVGHTYYYRLVTIGYSEPTGLVNSGYSDPVIVTVARGTHPAVFDFTPFVPTGLHDPTLPPTGLTAELGGFQLKYTTPALALASNSQIILFAISDTPDFVISSDVTCGTPMPLFIAARALTGLVTTGVTITGVPGTGRLVWSKSRGYLPGNSPNHSPPTNNFAQKFFFTQAVGGGAMVDESANFPPTKFPHLRHGTFAWQLSSELPAEKESWTYTDVPLQGGWLIYPNAPQGQNLTPGAGDPNFGDGGL